MPRGRREQHLELARACGFGDAIVVDAALAAAALREEVAPLVGARLARGQVEATPDAAPALGRAHREALARGLVRTRAVAPLLDALAAAGIPALLLKGAALERLVYGPGERPMSDVDLLVTPERFGAALEVARTVGATPLGPAGRPLTRRLDYAVALSLPPGVGVEIHRALAARPLFRQDAAAWLRRAARHADGALTPAPADLFLGLALHAAKHGFSLPLRSVIDGLLVADRLAVDWGEIPDRARALRARRAVAAWVCLLEAFGARREVTRPLLDALGRRAAAAGRLLAEGAPWPAADAGWARRARIVWSVEGLRGAGWLLWRSGLRVADAITPGVCWGRAPHRSRPRRA